MRRITLTYTLEGDASGTEHTMIVERQPDGAAVDGLVWSRGLMDRLAYVGEGQPVPQRPGRPQDGWTRRRGQGNGGGNGGSGGKGGNGGGSGGDADAAGAAAMSDPVDECIWLHTESCTWMSFCDPG